MFSGRRPPGLFASIFARPVKVSGTRIFARREGTTQALAYSMHLASRRELAMVLPIPVPRGSDEDAVAFVDLSESPWLFDQLRALFTAPAAEGELTRRAPQSSRLAVRSVGSFEASFVPSIADFARLDPRFRMSDDVWKALPRYADWGFAVFKLKKGEHRVHPMAFRFPSREPGRLFFPTVHVHDGEVHAEAEFDHELYWQGEQGAGDELGVVPASAIMEAQSRGIVRAGPVRRRRMHGLHANEDVWVA